MRIFEDHPNDIMRILFTSDLHSMELAFVHFANILRTQNFDCGIIAGDLLEDNVTPHEFIELLGVTEDDLIPELPGADETLEEALQRGIEELHNPEGNYLRALNIKEQRFRDILYTARKPLFIIQGNHDLTEWKSGSNIYNIHWKRITFGKYNFVGYHYTEFSRNQDQQRKDFAILQKYIDEKTNLVTHIPAYGILDKTGHDPSWSLGSRALSDFIQESRPMLHLHGHVHRTAGYTENSVNGSYPNLRKFFSINVGTGKITTIAPFPESEPTIEWHRRRVG